METTPKKRYGPDGGFSQSNHVGLAYGRGCGRGCRPHRIIAYTRARPSPDELELDLAVNVSRSRRTRPPGGAGRAPANLRAAAAADAAG